MADQNLDEAAAVFEPALPARTDEVRRTVWSIVLGAVGLIYAVWVLFGDVRYLAGMVQKDEASLTAATQPAAIVGNVANTNHVIGLILSIWLLWVSIGLLLRKSGLAKSMRTWAVTKLIWLGFNGAVIMVGTLQALQNLHAAQAGTAVGRAIGTILAVLVLMLPSAALPIFAVIWLSRRKIRSEMATWGRRPLSSGRT